MFTTSRSTPTAASAAASAGTFASASPASASSPASAVPGGNSAAALDAAITRLEAIERETRRVEAERHIALANFYRAIVQEVENDPVARRSGEAVEQSLTYRAARADASTALHLSEQTIDRHLEQAVALVGDYPSTLQALSAGLISGRHAAVIVDAGAVIEGPGSAESPESEAENKAKRSRYEARVLHYAMTTSPNRVRPLARRVAEECAAVPLDVRHERERQHRSVWVTARESGMAELGAYLPADEAYGIFSRLTRYAKRLEQIEAIEAAAEREARQAREADALDERDAAGSSVTAPIATAPVAMVPVATAPIATVPIATAPRRSRNERRADIFAELLLRGDPADGCSSGRAAEPRMQGIVQVITSDAHLSDAASANGRWTATAGTPLPSLEGYGPIPVSMARGIAGDAEAWNVVATQPGSGDVLRVDRYRPSEQMRRFLTARDQHCRFPGCRVPAYRCDVDHTVDAALGGETSTRNLGLLGHHTLKHGTGWTVEQHPNGDYRWTSPTGRTHVDRPASRALYPRFTTASPGLEAENPRTAPEPPGTGPEHSGIRTVNSGNSPPSRVRFVPVTEPDRCAPTASSEMPVAF